MANKPIRKPKNEVKEGASALSNAAEKWNAKTTDIKMRSLLTANIRPVIAALTKTTEATTAYSTSRVLTIQALTAHNNQVLVRAHSKSRHAQPARCR